MPPAPPMGRPPKFKLERHFGHLDRQHVSGRARPRPARLAHSTLELCRWADHNTAPSQRGPMSTTTLRRRTLLMAATIALSTWIVVPAVSAQPQTELQTNPLANDAKAIE